MASPTDGAGMGRDEDMKEARKRPLQHRHTSISLLGQLAGIRQNATMCKMEEHTPQGADKCRRICAFYHVRYEPTCMCQLGL